MGSEQGRMRFASKDHQTHPATLRRCTRADQPVPNLITIAGYGTLFLVQYHEEVYGVQHRSKFPCEQSKRDSAIASAKELDTH